MELELAFPDYEIVVRRDGDDILAVALFRGSEQRADVVVGYPSVEVRDLCAQLLIEIGQSLMSSSWKPVPDVAVQEADERDGFDLNDIPF